jgi:hypothetical protein
VLARPKGLKALAQSPHIRHVKHLWVQSQGYFALEPESLWTTLTANVISRCRSLVLVSELRNLRPVEQRDSEKFPHSWFQFEPLCCLPSPLLVALSKSSAHTLEHLHLNVDLVEHTDTTHITELLNAFGELQALRSLTMVGQSRCSNLGALKGKAEVSRFRLNPDAFPHLERLSTFRGSLLHSILLGGLCRVR